MSHPPSRIITHAEVTKLPDGGIFYLPADAELTPLAHERLVSRGIEIRPGSEGTMAPNPRELEETARRVLERLGPIPEDAARHVVAEVVATLSEGNAEPLSSGLPPSADYCSTYLEAERRRARRRAVLTASGRNQKGIVAILAAVISELGGDILDISQTLVGDYFTMLVIVDISELVTSFEAFKEALSQAARERGVQAILMHEDLVTSMHRV